MYKKIINRVGETIDSIQNFNLVYNRIYLYNDQDNFKYPILREEKNKLQ